MQQVRRLIREFIPENYKLSLDIDRPGRRAHGVLTMTGALQTDTPNITVHANGLEIQSATIDGRSATWSQGEHDELTLEHDGILPGPHVVVIEYELPITDELHGMYPCHFTHDGEKHELLVTQFESHFAREVLPCIDEPEAKATFDVTVKTETGITVLGNMPAIRQDEVDGRLVTTFDTTPRMSTYLLALVMGDMHSVTARTGSGVDVSVWATRAQSADSLQFALDHAVRTIEFFDEYFGVPYPLPKSDHVAMPDVISGVAAMENWGLVTYRQDTLVIDPALASVATRRRSAIVIAHELSHQWFGNLVTMRWWNNLWLNESFATLMEYVAVDALHPEWNVWLEFSTQETVIAMRRDSIDGVQSVQTDVNHPDEISTIFDGAIVYAKGARLMRMLETYVGPDNFRSGLGDYFREHAYGNTSQDDLWRALSRASGKNVAEFMDAWISQPGYPVVSVERDDDRAKISQRQFFVGPSQPASRLWPIPLGSRDGRIPELLADADLTIDYPASKPLRFNTLDSAHFISHYDLVSRDGILASITDDSVIGRLQFIGEQMLLARGGEITSAELVDILLAYADESSEPVWSNMSLALNDLKRFVETTPEAEQQLRKLAARLATAQYQRLGWQSVPDESEDDTQLRALVVGSMLYSETPEAIETALELYRTHGITGSDPELRTLIISTYVRHADDPDIIEHLFDSYRATPSAELQQDIAYGITAVRDEAQIALVLDRLRDTQTIRTQDTMHWFAMLIRNRYARTQTWRWMRENWEWIEQNFASDNSYDVYPRISASSLATRQQLDEYREFFAPLRKNPGLTRVIDMGLRDLEGRIELIERDQAAVIERLAELD